MTDTRSDTSTAEKEARDAAKHAPLNLPSGSFSLQDLEKVGKEAVAAKPEERDELVQSRLADVNKAVHKPEAANQLPGHKTVDVERTLVEGAEVPVVGGKKGETEVVGEVKVTESVQVFDPKKADEEVEAAVEATAGLAAAPAGTGEGATR